MDSFVVHPMALSYTRDSINKPMPATSHEAIFKLRGYISKLRELPAHTTHSVPSRGYKKTMVVGRTAQ